MKVQHLLLAAGCAYLVYRLTRESSELPSDAPPGPQPLFGGVPYLFIVALPLSTDAATAALQEAAARAFLTSKGATLISFQLAGSKPTVSFRIVPTGNSTVELGTGFYHIGTIIKLARLDARPFAEPPRTEALGSRV